MTGPDDTDLDDVDLAPTEIEGDEAEQIEEEGEPGGSNFV